MSRYAAPLMTLLLQASLLAADPPARLLDLSCWKLTLPIDTERPGRPDEIEQPLLNSFLDSEYFYVQEAAKGVVFRAPCGGSTSKGSSYPRCELREMSLDGRRETAWSTDDETAHTMTLRAAITKTPAVKPHVVCAQIHDADDDLLMVRLEGRKLFVERNQEGDVMLDSGYVLGKPFDLQIQAKDREIKLWHDGDLKMNWKTSRRGCYFKAGCYTQSNRDKGDAPEAYGEVVVYRLNVEHGKTLR